MEKKILISLKKNKNGSYAVLLQYCKEGTFLQSAGLTLRLNQNQFVFYKKNKRLPSTLLNYEVYNSYLNQEVGMDEILEILEKDARATPEDIAKMLKKKPQKIKEVIKKFEKEGVILKYKAVINKELIKNTNSEVRALIEVNIMPQKDVGFDKIAERIYSFPEVSSCYLISGTYDLLLIVEGRDLQTVSKFVAEKLSPLENIRGTVTHFLLKKYKEDGVILKHKEENKRIAISY